MRPWQKQGFNAKGASCGFSLTVKRVVDPANQEVQSLAHVKQLGHLVLLPNLQERPESRVGRGKTGVTTRSVVVDIRLAIVMPFSVGRGGLRHHQRRQERTSAVAERALYAWSSSGSDPKKKSTMFPKLCGQRANCLVRYERVPQVRLCTSQSNERL